MRMTVVKGDHLSLQFRKDTRSAQQSRMASMSSIKGGLPPLMENVSEGAVRDSDEFPSRRQVVTVSLQASSPLSCRTKVKEWSR